MATHGLDTSIIVFVVGVLVGGAAIAVGAKFVFKSKDYSHAVLTALLGALAWGLVDIAFARLGVEGVLSSLVGLLVWIWVIRWRYEVGWIRGSLLGIGAWLAAVVMLTVLAVLGVDALDAYGIPGV
jgi:hypothetical protein